MLFYRLYLIWGAAIIFSVLTVKQHYFWDVVAALVIVFSVKYTAKFYKYLAKKHKSSVPDLIDEIDDIQ